MNKSFPNAEAINQLAILVEESIRSKDEGVKRFVEPASGTFSRATSKTHSIVFGRRGSGKSSLLRKAATELGKKSPIAYVDLETFKDNIYPDVLLSILIQTFRKFEEWLTNSTTYTIKNIFSLEFHKYRREVKQIIKTLIEKQDELQNLLYSADQVTIQRTQKEETSNSTEAKINGKITAPISGIGSNISSKENSVSSDEIVSTYQHDKVQFLNRHTQEYQEVFRKISKIIKRDSYLFLDDLYYIRRADQSRVIDFFHRIAKNNNLWLKIGTVRHRSTWYVHGDPPYGLKLGDDAHDIDLDLTLEKYASTKAFLVKVLESFVEEVKINSLYDILVDDVVDRLVLASGGVTRDFLGIFNRSISVAQERRDRGDNVRGTKIGKEVVNVAAGEYYSTKMEEFKTDTPNNNEKLNLEDTFKRIRHFCIYIANSNIFLYEKAQESGLKVIQELMDLRLIHKIDSQVTVSKRIGKNFEAYILDVSAYAELRKRRGFEELPFWQKDTNIRRVGFILEEDFLLSNEPLGNYDNNYRNDNDSDKPEQLTLNM